jgi:hypothetical protein
VTITANVQLVDSLSVLCGALPLTLDAVLVFRELADRICQEEQLSHAASHTLHYPRVVAGMQLLSSWVMHFP